MKSHRVRSTKEIEKSIIDNFQKDFPGEQIHGRAFSVYTLDVYCRSVENYEICRQTLMRGLDIDL